MRLCAIYNTHNHTPFAALRQLAMILTSLAPSNFHIPILTTRKGINCRYQLSKVLFFPYGVWAGSDSTTCTGSQGLVVLCLQVRLIIASSSELSPHCRGKQRRVLTLNPILIQTVSPFLATHITTIYIQSKERDWYKFVSHPGRHHVTIVGLGGAVKNELYPSTKCKRRG